MTTPTLADARRAIESIDIYSDALLGFAARLPPHWAERAISRVKDMRDVNDQFYKDWAWLPRATIEAEFVADTQAAMLDYADSMRVATTIIVDVLERLIVYTAADSLKHTPNPEPVGALQTSDLEGK